MILGFELVFAAVAAILSILSFMTFRSIKHLGIGKSFWIPVFTASVLFVAGSAFAMLDEVGASLPRTQEVVYVSRISALCLLVGGVYSYSRKVKGSLHDEFTIPEQLIQERRNVATAEEDNIEVMAPIREERSYEERARKGSEEEPAFECKHQLGYLRTLPKNAPIPNECLGCDQIIECKHSLAGPLENRPHTA
jgi:hypothetical protein